MAGNHHRRNRRKGVQKMELLYTKPGCYKEAQDRELAITVIGRRDKKVDRQMQISLARNPNVTRPAQQSAART
jgi:hypothetical protein